MRREGRRASPLSPPPSDGVPPLACGTVDRSLNEREQTAKNNEARLHELERLLAQREAELRQAAVVRRALHNAVQELKGNIRVFCRVRPPANDEHATADAVGGGKNMDQPAEESSVSAWRQAPRNPCLSAPVFDERL